MANAVGFSFLLYRMLASICQFNLFLDADIHDILNTKI